MKWHDQFTMAVLLLLCKSPATIVVVQMLMHGADRLIAVVPRDSCVFAADDVRPYQALQWIRLQWHMEQLLCQADANVQCLQIRHLYSYLAQIEPLGVRT